MMLILQILIHRNIASSSSGGHGDVHGVRHALVAHHNGRYHVSVRDPILCLWFRAILSILGDV